MLVVPVAPSIEFASIGKVKATSLFGAFFQIVLTREKTTAPHRMGQGIIEQLQMFIMRKGWQKQRVLSE